MTPHDVQEDESLKWLFLANTEDDLRGLMQRNNICEFPA